MTFTCIISVFRKSIIMQFSLLCAVCIMFVSCYSGKTNITGEQHQLNVSEENIDTTYFNDHFEIAEVVPLQTDETNLISDIKRLIRYKNQIILLSGNTRQIFIINSKGGVIEQRIHKAGNGPGESNVILDIGFDESSEQLLVYNDYSKLLFFNLQGNFLSETKVDDLYEEMTVVDGKVIFHNKLEGYSCYPLMIKVFNLKDKSWESFGEKDKIDFPIRNKGLQLVKSKNVWFTSPLNYSLFVFKDNQIDSLYQINVPNMSLSEDLIKKSVSNPPMFFEEVRNNNLIYSFHSIRETNNFLVLRSNQPGLFIVDKANNNVYWEKMVKENAFKFDLSSYYYPHDGDDGKIMFVFPPEIYTNYVKRLYDKRISAEQIKAIEMREEDNPVLVFYKEKDN